MRYKWVYERDIWEILTKVVSLAEPYMKPKHEVPKSRLGYTVEGL